MEGSHGIPRGVIENLRFYNQLGDHHGAEKNVYHDLNE
jgi:hypothetical protein